MENNQGRKLRARPKGLMSPVSWVLLLAVVVVGIASGVATTLVLIHELLLGVLVSVAGLVCGLAVRDWRQMTSMQKRCMKRIFSCWLQTVFWYLMMAGLVYGTWCLAWHWFGIHESIHGWGEWIWVVVLPVILLLFSHKIALLMSRAVPVSQVTDPVTQARLQVVVDAVEELRDEFWWPFPWPRHIPVYYAPTQQPNAFATGWIPFVAVVAVTEGALRCYADMPDAKRYFKGIFAHELSHVFDFDVLVNQLIGMLAQVFFFFLYDILLRGISWLFRGIGVVLGKMGQGRKFQSFLNWWARKIKMPEHFHHEFGVSLLSGILLYLALIWSSRITMLIQIGCVRSREALADARAAYVTEDPCALAEALYWLVSYAEQNPPRGRELAFWLAARPMWFLDLTNCSVDANNLDDDTTYGVTGGTGSKIRKWWRNFRRSLMESHPSTVNRFHVLTALNGSACNLPSDADTVDQ